MSVGFGRRTAGVALLALVASGCSDSPPRDQGPTAAPRSEASASCDDLLGTTVTGNEIGCTAEPGVYFATEELDCEGGGKMLQLGFIYGAVGERFKRYTGDGQSMVEILTCAGE